MGATIYCCIAGTHPQPSNEREKNDEMIPIKSFASPAYSEELLDIVDWCLKLDHLARPQTAYELQKALMKGVPVREGGSDEASLVDDGGSFSDRLKKTFNKKLF